MKINLNDYKYDFVIFLRDNLLITIDKLIQFQATKYSTFRDIGLINIDTLNSCVAYHVIRVVYSNP